MSNARRIDLLRLLREPTPASHIRLAPSEGRGREARPMSTQAVRKHLDQLREHGFVEAARGRNGAGESWVVNHARLYAVAEEMRALAALRPAVEASGETLPMAREARQDGAGTPRLVVVHGLNEAQSFPLAGRAVIGRSKECAIRLDYDPFVSQTHAALARGPQGWVLEDLGSRNGTHRNWLALPAQGRCALAHGDVVGVGRTLLVFWA